MKSSQSHKQSQSHPSLAFPQPTQWLINKLTVLPKVFPLRTLTEWLSPPECSSVGIIAQTSTQKEGLEPISYLAKLWLECGAPEKKHVSLGQKWK